MIKIVTKNNKKNLKQTVTFGRLFLTDIERPSHFFKTRNVFSWSSIYELTKNQIVATPLFLNIYFLFSAINRKKKIFMAKFANCDRSIKPNIRIILHFSQSASIGFPALRRPLVVYVKYVTVFLIFASWFYYVMFLV